MQDSNIRIRRRRTSQKRLRVSLFISVCAAACRTSSSFVLSPSASRPAVAVSSGAPLFAKNTRKDSSSATPWSAASSQTTRLSHEEQRELLFDVVELRRIKSVLAEGDRSLQTSALQLARATGYGDEIDEMEQAMESGEAARERLVTSNMGLVYYCVNDIVKARQRKLVGIVKEDLVQEGAIGLARAVDRWNPAIGGKFSSYAVYWIRAAVLRCIAEKDDMMRVPEHVSDAVRKLSRAAATLGLQQDAWKEAAAAKALAEESGLTDKQLSMAIKIRDRRNVGIMSYESWMQKGKDFETDLNPAADDMSSINPSNLDVDQMKQTLSRFLRPREMEALSWRYGLNTSKTDYVAQAEAELFGGSTSGTAEASEGSAGGRWGEAMSFNEVGKQMKVSSEYGRRLCHAALNKLRQAAEEGALEPALLF